MRTHFDRMKSHADEPFPFWSDLHHSTLTASRAPSMDLVGVTERRNSCTSGKTTVSTPRNRGRATTTSSTRVARCAIGSRRVILPVLIQRQSNGYGSRKAHARQLLRKLHSCLRGRSSRCDTAYAARVAILSKYARHSNTIRLFGSPVSTVF